VPRDTVLAWQASETAVAHDVYFGTSFDDVSAADRANPLGVLVSEGQDATTYDPDGLLDFGQTYYWRVDEVNGAPDYTIFPGAVWSFTAEPFAYPITGVVATSNGASDADVGPGKTVDGSGLNADDQHSTDATDMWLAVPGAEPLQIQYEFDGLYKLHEMLVWNYNVQFELMLGFGLKDVTVEYSENGTDWTLLGDTELAQATAKSDYAANTTVAFEGVAARYVRLTVNSGYGSMGQFGLSEVRFTFIPATAREPQPADGQTALLVDATLGWRAGRSAVTHNVYLGTAPEALALTDAVSEASYVPGNLEYGHTYYWRIDEVNEADAVSVWEGDLWSFATEEYAVIDDMERYDDEENLIFDTWIDGFINDTGSTVGYFEAPFAEQTIVNGGGQSMPLEYDNSAAPFYSEAELDLGSANWTTYGADTLRLFVSGQAPAFFETADGSILVNAIGTDIWGTADEFRYAYKSLTGDGSMTARVEALDGTPSTWAKAGVMVRQSTDGGSRHSMMILTGGDGNGASWQGRLVDNAGSENTNMTDPVAPPYWVRIDRVGDSLSGFISADGQTWTQVGAARTIAMDDPVLIGLAVTSHNANQATSAEFSNIATTGNVMGNWQMAEVGVAQPEGNIPDTLYVAIEDTSGNMAVVTHPDANITARSGWTEWLVPHSDLAGVNLSRVAILIIGVGDRDNPTAGGAGLIYVDDIGVGHPATVE
ncbi:MAG: discoidin domain-containing protein, partial [Planctomycetota bacterium]